MLDVSEITEEFESETVGENFSASAVDVEEEPFPESNVDKEVEEKESTVEDTSIGIEKFSFKKPDRPVLAIDGTSYILGRSQNGAIGAIRIAIVDKKDDDVEVYKYGPYLLNINTKNRKKVYNTVRNKLFGKNDTKPAPKPKKTIDRMRSFLEKYIQKKLSAERNGDLFLFDGSLIEGTVDSPMGFMSGVVSRAKENDNDIAGITKRTSLTLKSNHDSVLSLLNSRSGPCAAYVNPYIDQERNRYAGDIYVAKLCQYADSFRIDISTDKDDLEILEELSGLCGEFGYPEELKIAHSHCKFSAVEILELQAAASDIYNLEFKDDLRKKLFGPWG